MLLVGYFEGIDSERGIAWRSTDSLALREFLGVALEQSPPNHSSVSRTRRRLDLETHQQVLQWILGVLAKEDLVEGKTLGIDGRFLSTLPPPWKPTRRYVRSCAGTAARAITNI